VTTALGHLLVRHAGIEQPRPVRIRGGLSGAAKRRVLELIAAALDARLTIERLAREVGLSPAHFARAFKETMGRAPHQYLLALRLSARVACSRRRRRRSPISRNEPALRIRRTSLASSNGSSEPRLARWRAGCAELDSISSRRKHALGEGGPLHRSIKHCRIDSQPDIPPNPIGRPA